MAVLALPAELLLSKAVAVYASADGGVTEYKHPAGVYVNGPAGGPASDPPPSLPGPVPVPVPVPEPPPEPPSTGRGGGAAPLLHAAMTPSKPRILEAKAE
jgi:hypothetical protein